MRYLILGTLLATASAGPALAQEAAADSPFTGPHVEVLAGYDNLGGTDNGRDGLLYGIGAGYDFQLGGAVAGIEGPTAVEAGCVGKGLGEGVRHEPRDAS